MNTGDILSIFVKGAMGARGRKRARKAARFLSGNKGFLSASTVLGAAGVAWGIYDTLQAQGASGHASASPGTATSPSHGAMTPPPLPASAAARVAGARGLADDVLRVVRLAVSAARADGTLLPAERALILEHAREAGVDAAVEAELDQPRPLTAIVGGVTDPQQRRDLYALAFTIVRADESVSGAERVYLAQLAHQLGLDASTVAAIEADVASRIDAEPDTPV